MLSTSKNVLFSGHNHLLTTGADDPTLWLLPECQFLPSDFRTVVGIKTLEYGVIWRLVLLWSLNITTTRQLAATVKAGQHQWFILVIKEYGIHYTVNIKSIPVLWNSSNQSQFLSITQAKWCFLQNHVVGFSFIWYTFLKDKYLFIINSYKKVIKLRSFMVCSNEYFVWSIVIFEGNLSSCWESLLTSSF